MQVLEVKTQADKSEFLLLPLKIYGNDKNWIRPLNDDVIAVFDEKKNKFFKHGVCTRWILKNSTGETIGRVAAFIDNKTSKKMSSPPVAWVFLNALIIRALRFCCLILAKSGC